MLIWDAHLDLAFLALNANRNLLDPVEKTRTKERQFSGCLPPHWRGAGEGTVAFPEMRTGRVAVSFPTLLSGVSGHCNPYVDYETVYQSYGIAHGHLAYYRALEQAGIARIITTLPQLETHITEWEEWDRASDEGKDSPPLGFIINIEGADPIQNPGELAEWHAAGMRVIMLGHFGPGRYTGGTGTDLPLTDAGKALLDEAYRLGMIFDANHLSDRAFWQAMDHFQGSVIASHSNARRLVPGQRQLSDEQIKAVVTRGGVIGVCMDVWMLEPDWVPGVNTNENVSLETVVDHIDTICQLAGDSSHVGIGTDLDGGYGFSQCPRDLNTIADLQKLDGMLKKRGYAQADIAGIFYRNFLNLVVKTWQ